MTDGAFHSQTPVPHLLVEALFSKSDWKPIRSRAGLISAFDMKELPSRPVMLNHDDNRSLIQSDIDIFKPIPESLKPVSKTHKSPTGFRRDPDRNVSGPSWIQRGIRKRSERRCASDGSNVVPRV